MIYNAQLPIKPELALEIHQGLMNTFRQHGKRIRDRGSWGFWDREDDEETWAAISGQMKKAEVVLWENTFWNLAMRGAEDAFSGLTLDPEQLDGLLRVPSQLWILRWPIPAVEEFFGDGIGQFMLDRLCTLLGAFVMGVAGHPPDRPGEISCVGALGVWIFAPIVEGEAGAVDDLIPRLRISTPYWASDQLGTREAQPWHADFLAGLKFLTSELVALSPARRPRQQERLAIRKRAPLPDLSGVKVITLRKRHSDRAAGEAEPMEWSCRWLVRGHWRQQWYPSRDKHEPKFVGPYVKGPEDKPFRPPRDSIYIVRR